MADGPEKAAPWGSRRDTYQVETLASRVLTVVSSRVVEPKPLPESDILDFLQSFVIQRDDRQQFLTRMSLAGVSDISIADIYIPAAARELGAAWLADQISFMDVTIGTARLQRLLRDIGARAPSDSRGTRERRSVLVATPVGNDHTLGAVLLGEQLRRRGLSVRLALSVTHAEMAEHLEATKFEAIMISVSGSDRLKALQKLINLIRRTRFGHGPIVVGGPCIEFENCSEYVKDVDCFTSDLDEAVRYCGLGTNSASAGLRAKRN